MTLIAQLSVNRAPILIGDVLLSSERRTGLKANLPLVGDINRILSDRGLPFEVDFAQKVHVFDGRLAVAWSGPTIQAERALRVLSVIASRPTLTEADVRQELSAIDQVAINQLLLIGLVLEGTEGASVRYSSFSFGAPFEQLPNIGRVCAAGSGRTAFLHLLQKYDWPAPGSANEYQVAHALLGTLINEEYRTGNTIANRWGGGFEALTFSHVTGRFEKIGDVLHTFWTATENPDDAIGLYPFLYKTTYWLDALVVRTMSLEQFQDDKFRLRSNEVTVVPPLLKGIECYDLAKLGSVDFSYRAVCCHVLIEKSSNRDLLLVTDQNAARQDVLFRLDDSRCALQVSDYLPNMIREKLGH